MRPRDAISHPMLRRLAIVLLLAAASTFGTVESAAASPTPCTVNWTGAAGDGQWSNAGNWDTGTVPTSSDEVCINVGADATGSPLTVTLTTSPTVAGLELGDGTLVEQGGSQTLTATGELDLEAVDGDAADGLGSGLGLVSEGTATVDPGLDVCLASGDTLSNAAGAMLTLGDGSDLGGAQAGSTCPSGSTGGSVTSTGTVTSNATVTQATIDTLSTATGSTLEGPGTLAVGALTMPSGSGGQVDLSGDLLLQAEDTLTVQSNVQVCTYPGTTIDNAGALTLGADADLGAADTVACDNDSGAGEVTNDGTITTGASAVIAPAFFDDEGAVSDGGGTLAIPASSSDGNVDAGTYAIASGATLNFSGTSRNIDYGGSSGTTFSGAGQLTVSSGTTDFGSDADLSTLSRFTVDADATAEVDVELETAAAGAATTMIEGDLDGYGTTTVVPQTTLQLVGPDAQLGEYVDLVDQGVVSVGGSAKVCLDQGATFENAGGGVLTLGSSSTFGDVAANPNCDGAGTILNDAGAQINSGAGATINAATFDNAGAVSVPAGTLVLDAANEDTDTGGYTVGSGATLSVQGGVTRVLDGTLAGAGKLALTGSGTSLEITPAASGSIGSLSIGTGTTLQLDAGPGTPTAPAGSRPSGALISVTGTAALNGTIAFNGDALITPTSAQTVALLSYGGRSGNPESTPPDDNGWSAIVPPSGGPGEITANVVPPPPDNTTLPVISGSPVVGATLSLTQGTWSGAPGSITDQWEDCDPTSGDCSAIGGATGTSYAPSANDVGEQLEVIETATNATGATSTSSGLTDAVTSLAPTNLDPPDINGDEGTVGESLTEVPGAWTNSPSITLQWEDCDVTGTICTPIPGATGLTYVTTEKDDNDTIVVVETATNAYGSAETASEPTSLLFDDGDDDGDDGTDGTDGTDGSSGGNGSGGSASGTASVSIASHTVHGTDVAVDVSCPRASSCLITLTLRASETVPASSRSRARPARPAKPAKPKSRTVLVGTETVALSSGRRRTVTVALNRTGKKLLDSDHTLHVVLTAMSRSQTLGTERVTFRHTTPTTRRSSAHPPTSHHPTTHRGSHARRYSA